MQNPLLSAIMPCYNSEKDVAKAIESVIAQAYQNWQLVIVNDASTDKSAEIVKKYAGKDNRIIFLENDKNMGFAFTRDRAIEESTGEIIVITDSDDKSYDFRFETTAKAYESDPSIDIFYSNVDYHYSDTDKTERRFFQPFVPELLFCINFIPDPGVSFKKSVYLELGGYDFSIRIGADYDLWLRALRAGKKFSFTDKSLAQYEKNQTSLTSKTSPEALKNRQHWNRTIREKNKIFEVNVETVKTLAEKDVVEFYVNKNFDIWFSSESIPEK